MVRPTPWERKCDQSPLPMANPRITKAAMAANLVQVERFCSSVPQRRPDDVYISKDRDEEQTEKMCAGDGDSEKRENYVLLRDDGEDLSGVGGGSDGESGDGAAVGDAKSIQP